MGETNEKWYITQQTFPELLNRNIETFGERRAQWWRTEGTDTTSITYRELGHTVEEMSTGLMELGIEKGDRIAIMAHTCPQWVWADYSILCAAGITVCIYPTLSVKEVVFIVNDSGSRILYVENDEILRKVIKVWQEMPTLEKIVVMQNEFTSDNANVLSLNDLKDLGKRLIERDSSLYEKRWKSVQLHDNMTIVYTSGTTGTPKGAVHTHFSINAACRRDLSLVPPLKEDDVFLSFLPLAHTYERQCGHGTVMHGAVTVAYSSPKTIVEDLQIFRPTVFMSVPRIYERIYMAMRNKAAQSPIKNSIFNYGIKVGLEVVDKRSDDNGFVDMSEDADFFEGLGFILKLKYKLIDRILFSKVRALIGGRYRFAFSAAGSLPADLCRVFMAMGIRIYEGYGATETCNTVNLNKPDRVLPGSVGPLCAGVEGRMDEDGEWFVKGDNNIREYWNNSEATKEAFTEDGFYRTGDIVEMLADGYIKIVDRKKGLMVLDTGKNVPSAKIESKFSLSDYIDIVMPIGDDRKFVTALVVPNLDVFINYFKENSISYDMSALEFTGEGTARVCVKVGDDFVEKEELRAIIDAEIRKANEELEEYESIRNYFITSRRFTEQTGEMTPTLKVKRSVVMKNFEDVINGMYR
ncbi:MAG: long-chain fatty acid--CoA ligase [Deltaproteobacteria bacterium]|nr:long-chain fatty acid--CoA ligase [Deltaproteobacteria bacterium]